VYGPKFAVHSGHYGNWVPNPGIRLAQLLGSMKDEQGRVTVAGFYDGIPPLSEDERRILRAVPDDPAGLQKLLGVARFDAVGESLQEAIQFPSLNLRGLRSGYVGDDARTIIPAEATAAVDVRLVKETPSAPMVEKVLAHIRKQGFHIVEGEPDDATRLRHPKLVRVTTRRATDAYRTEMNVPESVAVARALEQTWGREPVLIRTSGGTVPLSPFVRALGFPVIGVPTVNFDNNQHSENENLRLGHFWNAIVTMATLLSLDSR
ncbi:MAG: peptidase dimerization domain-containing protein, partial [Gemmatimonadales bacterium]